MKKIFEILNYAPKRVTAVLLIVLGVLVSGAVIFAWGPTRTTYTMEHPADHVTFDSITDNPNYGDERNFVIAKDASNTSPGGWSDTVNVTPGHEYLVRIYVHDNAASNLNLVANNTRVMANVPTTTGTQAQIDGFITADNASPQQVWDDVVLKSGSKFNLAYEAGSAHYYNNIFPKGVALPDSIVTNSGAKVGYEQMDGNVPGCLQYSGIASFKVKAQGELQPNFEMSKQVKKDGTTGWQKSITAQPGDKIDYLISYNNTGQTTQDNVTVKDALPASVSYQAGSTKYTNASQPQGHVASDNIVKESGINVGSYTAGSNAFVTFQAKIADSAQLKCGKNLLRNTGYVSTANGIKQDTADVTVDKVCKSQPSVSCDLLQAKQIGEKSYSFNVNLTATSAGDKTAKAEEVIIDFGDGHKATRDASSLPVEHTYAKPGQYTVKAVASFEVDGKTVDNVTSDACQTIVNTTNTPPTSLTGTASTPTSLPATGPAAIIGSLFGVGALGFGAQQWATSRRAVKEAIGKLHKTTTSKTK